MKTFNKIILTFMEYMKKLVLMLVESIKEKKKEYDRWEELFEFKVLTFKQEYYYGTFTHFVVHYITKYFYFYPKRYFFEYPYLYLIWYPFIRGPQNYIISCFF